MSKYEEVHEIRLKDGTSCKAKLIHLNPRFHGKIKDPRDLDVWRRENPEPGQRRYIQRDQVAQII